MINYYQQTVEVDPNDIWPDCITDPNDSRCIAGWREADGQNLGSYGRDGREYLALERCNFVSNLAFYRAATRICEYDGWNFDEDTRKALKQSFVTLATGSAYMHASHTNVGGEYDNSMIAVILYITLQGFMNSLDVTNQMLLSYGVEGYISATELAENIAYLPLNHDPKDWDSTLRGMRDGYPRDYSKPMVAFFFLGFALVLPWDLAVWTQSQTEELFGTDESLVTWRQDEYQPAVKELVENYRVPWYNIIFAAMKLTGMQIKMFWAFVWQEWSYNNILPEWLYTPTAMWFFMKLTPHINFFASMLSWFPQDETMVAGKGVYPGSSYCNWHSPHALWHEQSANAFVEVAFLADWFSGALKAVN